MERQLYNVVSLPDTVTIGRRSETGVTAVHIDCTAWLAYWPNLTISLWVTPPNSDAAYPANTRMEGTELVWVVNNADTAVEGRGTMEIVGTAPGRKKLSAIASTKVLRTTTLTQTTPPAPAQGWVDQVLYSATRAEEAAKQAADSAEEAKQAASESGGGGIAEETDPTVPAWAKQPNKPTYTPEEVGLGNAVTLDKLYRVGDLYLTTNSASPAGIFGGTWERIEDCFLLAAGSTYAAGSTGGEAAHTLTIAEMPNHRHQSAVVKGAEAGDWWVQAPTAGAGGTQTAEFLNSTNYVGGDEAHNNMPPYLAVYVWRRVA